MRALRHAATITMSVFMFEKHRGCATCLPGVLNIKTENRQSIHPSIHPSIHFHPLKKLENHCLLKGAVSKFGEDVLFRREKPKQTN